MTQSVLDPNRSPRLRALLAALRGRIVAMIWLSGLGRVFAVIALWAAFAFLADWLLHVPHVVRIFHGLVLLCLPAYVGLRELARLRRVPDAAGLALLAERGAGPSEELLVSAVQLAPEPGAPRDLQRALIASVVARAEERAATLDVRAIVSARLPLRRFASGCACLLGTALFFAAFPLESGIFLQRMLGRAVDWPQRTHLSIEVPAVGEQVQVVDHGERLAVRMARGGDLALIVRAEGVVPDEVELHFASGAKSILSSGGGPLFRTRLRSLQESTRIWATGGDDKRGLPVVEIEVLEPPDVIGVAVTVVPPAYTGLPPRTVFDRDVEALAGSALSIHVLPEPATAQGVARLLPSDRTIALVARAFPSQQPAESERAGLAFELAADESFRYRFEIVDSTGLSNPDPGLFGVQVVADRPPELALISPSRADLNVVQGGLVSLRVRASDDFGIRSLGWKVRRTESEEILSAGELERLPNPAAEGAPLEIGRARLEIASLSGAEPLPEGSQLLLQVEAEDSKEPEPNRVSSPPVRLRIVSSEEYMRRLQDDLARVGEQVRKVSDLVDEKIARLRELESVLSGEDALGSSEVELEALLAGTRRVQGDSRAVLRELAGVTQALLYSRLDARAGPLLDALDERLGALTDKGFDPEPWREVGNRYAAGELGSAELGAVLLEMVGLALGIAEDQSLGANEALMLAREAEAPTARLTAVAQAGERLELARKRLEELSGKLAEWDNFQSVLSNLRDIIGGQKNLLERTRQFAKDH